MLLAFTFLLTVGIFNIFYLFSLVEIFYGFFLVKVEGVGKSEVHKIKKDSTKSSNVNLRLENRLEVNRATFKTRTQLVEIKIKF